MNRTSIAGDVADSWFKERLTLVAIVAAVWRVGYLVIAKGGVELSLNNSLYYSIQADLNADGRWFEDGLSGLPGAEHGFVTSMYLTPWSFGTGAVALQQRLGITVVGIASVVVVGLAGRRLGEIVYARSGAPGTRRRAERVGLVAAGVAAVYPNFWIHDSLVASEGIAVFVVALALVLAFRHHESLTVRSAIPLGVVTGFAALTRSELVLLVVGFAAVTWFGCRRRGRSRGPAVALLIAGVTVVLPWSLYNLGRFDEATLLSTNDGTALLGANCDTTYYDDIGGWSLTCLGGTLVPLDSNVDPSNRASIQRDRALTYMDGHFSRIPVVVTARLGRLLDVYGLDSLVELDRSDEKAEWAVWGGIVSWWLLAAIALVGWRGMSSRRLAVRWWLAVPWFTVVVTAAAFYGSHRIRASSEPVVVLLAAVAAVAAWERVVGDGRIGRAERTLRSLVLQPSTCPDVGAPSTADVADESPRTVEPAPT